MKKKIGIFWLRDDFRIAKNLALAYATKNHNRVVVLYLFKEKKYANQEAQKWWINKSLNEFKKKLLKFNIEIQIFKVSSYKDFLKKNY